jgi:hypothetical protein
MLSLLISLQCSTGKDANDKAATIYSLGIQEFFYDSTYFKACQLIPLETNDNSLLHRITRICSHDGKLFVFDERLSKVVVFDMQGRYLTHIHRIGQGPEEYISLSDICLDTTRKQILLLCDRPYKIMRFSYLGDFVGEKKLKDLYFNLAEDSGYIYCNQLEIGEGMSKHDYELMCMDSSYNVISKHLSLRAYIENISFIEGRALTSTLNACYVRRFDNTIYQLNGGALEKKYIVDFKDNNLPTSIIKNINNVNIYTVSEEGNYIFTMVEVCDSENYLMFKTNLGFFVYDKKKNTLNGYREIFNSQFGIFSSRYLSVGSSSQMIASSVNASYLYFVKKESKNYSDDERRKVSDLLKRIEHIQEDDNPVLLLYEFK